MPMLFVAQAVVEHGLLSSIGAGFVRLRQELEGYVGEGRTPLILLGALLLVLWLTGRRRR